MTPLYRLLVAALQAEKKLGHVLKIVLTLKVAMGVTHSPGFGLDMECQWLPQIWVAVRETIPSW
jgi:hypothetical protein